MPLERRLDDPPLHAASASVDDANLGQTAGGRGVDVFLHHRSDVARGERVEIELVLDRNANRLFSHVDALSFQLWAGAPSSEP